MAISFKVPDSPKKSIFEIDNFEGADFTNTPATVDIHKSPNLVNMVRDVPGKIRKSMGWYKSEQLQNAPINGAYSFEVLSEIISGFNDTVYQKRYLVHCGTNMYYKKENETKWALLASGLKDHTSVAFPLSDAIYVLDGDNLWKGYLKSDGSDDDDDDDDDGDAVIQGFQSCIYYDSSKLQLYLPFSRTESSENATYYEAFWKFTLSDGKVVYPSYQGNGYIYLPWIIHGQSATVTASETTGTSKKTTSYTYDLSATTCDRLILKASDTKKAIVIANDCSCSGLYKDDTLTYKVKNLITGVVNSYTSSQYIDGFPGNRDSILGFSTANIEDGYYEISTTQTKYADSSHSTVEFSVSGSVNVKVVSGAPTEMSTTNVKTFVLEKCTASKNVYIPKLTISKNPSGGGTAYEDLNMLNPAFTESFVVTSENASATEFHMSFSKLDDTVPIVEKMDSNGKFQKQTYKTDFTFNSSTGVINFVTAPGVSPVTGEDNVKITAYRTVAKYADKINHCTIGALFGVNGATDRLFVSGNEEYPNYDWFSGQNDGTYFPDTGYSIVGRPDSSIVGYTIINNYLAAHKDSSEADRNVILRQGNLTDNKPVFPIVAMLQGQGAIAKHSFQYINAEPLFLTGQGVYAITAQDITGEKYGQNRSFFLNGKLLAESNLKNAISCIFNNQYVICVNNHLYILDGLQPIQTDKSMPYSTRQYAGFYRTNVPATAIWVWNNELCFGTKDGYICKFHTDKTDVNSYNDDGAAISCLYDTPDFNGQYFFQNKTFRYLAVRLDSALRTSIQYWVMRHGIWTFIKTEAGKPRWIDFANMNFAKFSFSTDSTQKTLHTKIRIKKVDKARFRFINDQVNEPFGLYNVALEYIENGNYKG